jgi:hypothetical protein
MQDRVRGGTQESSAAASFASIRAALPNPRAAVHKSVCRLLLCCFLSGAAALIYQAAWTKLLALLFGYSAYALGTVLAAFMSPELSAANSPINTDDRMSLEYRAARSLLREKSGGRSGRLGGRVPS